MKRYMNMALLYAVLAMGEVCSTVSSPNSTASPQKPRYL